MKFFRNRILVVFAIFSLLIYEFTPSFIFAQQRGRPRVGFIGFKFDGVSEKTKREITNGILYLLAKKPSIEIVSPEEAVKLVGSDKINSVLSYPAENDVIILSHMLGVDYLFFGSFVNQGKDTNDVFLVGRFECYDKLNSRFHTVDITWRYDNIDEGVKKIDRDFIRKILPRGASIMTSLFFIIVLGLIIIGTYTLIWGLSGTPESDSGVPPTTQ
jgi:hypothetical protein